MSSAGLKAPIVLASRSPRRRAILNALGLDHEIRPSPFDESEVEEENPIAFAQVAARGKADTAALAHKADFPSNVIVVGVDTVVHLNPTGPVIGKPQDLAEAAATLQTLSGRAHYVTSGIAFAQQGHTFTLHETARVVFRELSDREIRAYTITGDPLDKAGSYGIQGRGGTFIEELDGDFFNVMGLPVRKLIEGLSRLTPLPNLNIVNPPERFQK